MPRRRLMQKPRVTGPILVGNPAMARNARRPGTPNRAIATPAMLTNPGRPGRPLGAMPSGAKSRNTFWTRVPVIGGLMNLIAGLLFPKGHLRVMERKRVGTGLSVIRDRTSRRKAPRAQGVTQVKASQHARGEIPGVLQYPGQKRKAA